MYVTNSPNAGDVPVSSDNSYYYYQDSLTGEIYGVPRQAVLPPFISGSTSTTGSTGGYIQSGQSWLNDLLNFGLGLAAIGNRGTIQGGAINPLTQQPVYNSGLGLSPEQLAALRSQQNTGAQFGGSIQNFITRNSGILLILGIGVVLWKSGRK